MAPVSKLHIVMAGNPGVGKSAILNSLIGKVVFNAGVNIGKGMTEVLDSHELPDRIYSDTPGLDEFAMRKKAAKEISAALAGGGKFKLIFVCVLEAGRIRPSDIVTIVAVLQAIEDIGVKTEERFSVIVNKCGVNEMEVLKSPRNRELFRNIISAKKKFNHLQLFPFVPLASDMDDFLIDDIFGYAKFVQDAPSIMIPTGKSVNVDASSFDDPIGEIEKELMELNPKLADIEEEKDDGKWRALMNYAVHGICQAMTSTKNTIR